MSSPKLSKLSAIFFRNTSKRVIIHLVPNEPLSGGIQELHMLSGKINHMGKSLFSQASYLPTHSLHLTGARCPSYFSSSCSFFFWQSLSCFVIFRHHIYPHGPTCSVMLAKQKCKGWWVREEVSDERKRGEKRPAPQGDSGVSENENRLWSSGCPQDKIRCKKHIRSAKSK